MFIDMVSSTCELHPHCRFKGGVYIYIYIYILNYIYGGKTFIKDHYMKYLLIAI